jgi:polysaccharide export outer membrane protein
MQRAILIVSFLLGLQTAPAFQTAGQSAPPATSAESLPQRSDYVLGPDDEIAIRALDAEEISNKPMRIDGTGNINVPMLGRVHASGLTVRQLEAQIKEKLATYVLQPEVSIVIMAYRSQPVTVLGSINRSGTMQLEGRKTLLEVLSLAGGPSGDAGNILKVTRRKESGPIPLPNVSMDESCQCSIAELSLKSLIEARKPEENIIVMPHDVLSIPRGQMIYVIGDVRKSGGFVLSQRESISVLQALALAEGLGQTAAAKNARILRPVVGASRIEIAVNLQDIWTGKKADMAMQPEDILFVPSSYAKGAWRRTMDSLLHTLPNIAVYRGW